MKKKLEQLLQTGQADSNELFNTLHQNYVRAKNTLEQSEAEKAVAKQDYTDASKDKARTREEVFSLFIRYKKAKLMRQYHKADYTLEKFRLESFLHDHIVKAPKAKGDKKAKTPPGKQVAPEKVQKAPRSSGQKTRTATAKATPNAQRRRKPE